jgi:hypothetical protein
MALLGVLGVPTAALAQDNFIASLIGFQEVPSISTDVRGVFRARIVGNRAIEYTLSYSNLEANAQQAHIHFGQQDVNGGISVFLCTNLAVPPPPAQRPPRCPLRSGVVTGMLTANDVIGPAGQGIAAGEFAELLRAIRAGMTYANVHSALFPTGEIRGQLRRVVPVR